MKLIKNKHKKSPCEAATSTKAEHKSNFNYTLDDEKNQAKCAMCEKTVVNGNYSQYGSLLLCFRCANGAEVDLGKGIPCYTRCGSRATTFYGEFPICAVCNELKNKSVQSIKEGIK